MSTPKLFLEPKPNFVREGNKWSGKTSGDVPWELQAGDALQCLSEMPDDFYNCVITSPPYYWLRDYGVEGQVGKEETVKDRPSRSYEFVFMFVKSRKYHFNRQPLIDKNVDEDVWTIAARPKQANGIDTAPFPDELVQRCLDIGCPEDGRILDQFAGSGTTLRVALRSGRSATGIELNPTYCEHVVTILRDL